MSQLFTLLRQGIAISARDVTYGLRLILAGQEPNLSEIYADVIVTTSRGKQVRPKTRGQRQYVQAMRDQDIVFGIGPAGTGKTYLAMAMAVAALRARRVSRLILTPSRRGWGKVGFYLVICKIR